MLSHLRFHRRGTSNPASPMPDQHHSFTPLSSHESAVAHDFASASSEAPPPWPSSTALPPTLPPIKRVTSADADTRDDWSRDLDESSPPDKTLPSPYDAESPFLGGIVLRNHHRDVVRLPSGDGPLDDQSWRPQNPTHTSTGTKGPPIAHIRPMVSFSTPLELQNPAATAVVPRPAGTGTKLSNQVSLLSAGSTEPQQRGKKGLPFLKNPMSTLLMRRKNNHVASDLAPLPLGDPKEEPVYDPRIRGTRVHDFSAPRLKQGTSGRDTASCPASSSQPDVSADQGKQTDDFKDTWGPEIRQPGNSRNASDPPHSASFSRASQFTTQPTSGSSDKAGSSLEQALALVDDKYAPPVPPPKDNMALPPQPSLSIADNDAQETDTSARTPRRIKNPVSEISALPKHMKSTSSRFSFDMIGAAKQEKLLEERHRQRELEKQTTDIDEPRDCRFDDLDDAFDYDATMLEDDGLEEKIPGINADPEKDDEPSEDELDADNDQENFAGFVFQRSGPASSASPQSAGMAATPRDAEDKVCEFATTKGRQCLTDLALSSDMSPWTLDRTLGGEVHGLGIRDACVPEPLGPPPAVNRDDLYFDDGIIGLEDEFAKDLATQPEASAVPLDESIFDYNDTDQFGRPVPGAFARAQSLRRAAEADSAPPESQTRDGHDVASPRLADTARDSVAAYQAALVAAAHEAAASGQFQRSPLPRRRDEESRGDKSPLWENEDLRAEYFDTDKFELGDDAIIAEANASALANDSDGWYGQEFGFYSAPVGAGGGQHHGPQNWSSTSSRYEYANGGFFCPRGLGDLGRSSSGRMVSREPNLTPITERSEYSNRNSLMSPGFPLLSSPAPWCRAPGSPSLR